jgi:hypothetical protein
MASFPLQRVLFIPRGLFVLIRSVCPVQNWFTYSFPQWIAYAVQKCIAYQVRNWFVYSSELDSQAGSELGGLVSNMGCLPGSEMDRLTGLEFVPILISAVSRLPRSELVHLVPTVDRLPVSELYRLPSSQVKRPSSSEKRLAPLTWRTRQSTVKLNPDRWLQGFTFLQKTSLNLICHLISFSKAFSSACHTSSKWKTFNDCEYPRIQERSRHTSRYNTQTFPSRDRRKP